MPKMMKLVPVGAEPKVQKYRGEDYLGYGWAKNSLYPKGSLDSMIDELVHMRDTYQGEYQNMTFQEARDCGCYDNCSCSPSYVLYGERLETDLEYDFRLKCEEKIRAEREAREKAEYERLRKRFETP